MGLGIYTVGYIPQHAFSTLTLFGPKYSHGVHIRQVLAVSSNRLMYVDAYDLFVVFCFVFNQLYFTCCIGVLDS